MAALYDEKTAREPPNGRITMAKMNRRQFGGAAAAGAASLAAGPAFAQGSTISFISYTYAEEPNKPVFQKVMDDFKAASGVTVDPIASAWGETQKNIMLRQRSRTLMDSAQLQDRWVPSMATLPEIVDIGGLIPESELEAALAPSVLSLGRVGEKRIGVPFVSGSVGFVANTDVLKKAGVDKIPVTMDEFRSALVAVRDKVPNSAPFAMATKNPSSIPLDVLLLVWIFNGRIIDDSGKVVINSPEGRAAMSFMASAMKDRLIAPELDRPDSRRLFAQGSAAFYIDAPQARGFIRSFSGLGEKADAFTLPMKSPVLKQGDPPRSVEWGHVVALFKGQKPIDKGGPQDKWVRYLISDATQTTFPLQIGGLPVTKSARAAPAVQNDPFLKAWAEATGVTMKHEIGVWSNAPELSTILSEETQAALLGQKTPDGAVAAMQTRMEASMAKRG